MQPFVALFAGLVSLTLGLVVLFAGGQRRIGGLLVANGLTVGIFLGGPQSASTNRTGMVVDQLTQGSWVFLFLWLVLIGYLLPHWDPSPRRVGGAGSRWVWPAS